VIPQIRAALIRQVTARIYTAQWIMGIPKNTSGVARVRLIKWDRRGYGVKIEYVDGRSDKRFVGNEEEAFVAVMDELKKVKYIDTGSRSAARRITSLRADVAAPPTVPLG
jgi:hypothetical protein